MLGGREVVHFALPSLPNILPASSKEAWLRYYLRDLWVLHFSVFDVVAKME